MSEDLVHTDESPIYHRLSDEDATQYEAFSEWARTPPSARNMANFCRRTGFPPRVSKKLREQFQWDVRANAFDIDSMQLRPNPEHMEEEAALAGQLAAAQSLIDLGLNALATKNPSLIPIDKALKLASSGVEMQRKALGQADLNVQFNVEDLSRVNKMFGEIIGEVIDEEVEYAEVVDESEDQRGSVREADED